ncbi:MAG: hypothetical protein K8R89_05875, partial [Anaerolineae bacterium]|nr:hypothetical protein [Anaerolineae bacterium]
GSGQVELRLPAASTFSGLMFGGSGRLVITLPEKVGLRIDLDSGSGSFRPAARFRLVAGTRTGDGRWETENYDTADYQIELEIDQGSGSIIIN